MAGCENRGLMDAGIANVSFVFELPWAEALWKVYERAELKEFERKARKPPAMKQSSKDTRKEYVGRWEGSMVLIIN